MTFPNLFSADAWENAVLAAAIENLPIQYGRVIQSGLFRVEGIDTTVALIEEYAGTLAALPHKVRGEAATKNRRGSRTLRSFDVPHIPVEDTVQPGDIQNVRAFGSMSGETLLAKQAKILQQMRNKIDISREVMAVHALAGLVVDPTVPGSPVKSLHTEFGETETVQDFVLDNSATIVADKCHILLDSMDDAMKNWAFNEVVAYCSPEFFRAFISHASVLDAYKYHTANVLDADRRKGFPFCGIRWIQYHGSVGGNRLIEQNAARVFPVGAPDMFSELQAPANNVNDANKPGKVFNVTTETLKHSGAVEIRVESNPLMLCKRPKALIKVTI